MTDQERGWKLSPAEGGEYPKLLGVMEVTSAVGGVGIYRCSLPPAIGSEFTILLEADAKEFPLEKYCRYVRHPGGRPYTFSSMEFDEVPPGIRVGPWPGWRGIPEFPVVSASCGSVSVRLQPTFWGDEITRGIIRMFGRFSDCPGGPITFTVADPQIIPQRASFYQTHALKVRPHPIGLLPELVGVHPRLLITPELLPGLRACRIGSHKKFWEKLISVWNNRHLPFEKDAESKCIPGPERLAGEDRVLISAFIALISEREEDIQQAREEYGAYVRQTMRPDFEPLTIDTQSGEVLFVLSTGYDWLFPWMSGAERRGAWEQIERVAGICNSFLTADRTDFGQAHYLGCGLGLVAYSLLLPDNTPDSSGRIAELRGALDCALKLLAKDGSYPHGINLWIYEFGFLLRWIELFQSCAGDDLWSFGGPLLECASAFRAATLSLDGCRGITFGDPQYRVGGDSWCHFLIASRTGSQLAQGLGEQLLDLPHEGVDFRSVPARRRVYEYLFYSPAVMSTPSDASVRSFHEIGQVTIRSERTLFTLRSGPPLGRARYAAGEYGAYGHSDPASGAFLIEHDGQMIASGPGPVYRRDTSLHNVVTIDGQGQVGDSTVWLPDFLPPEVLPPVLEIEPEASCINLFADITNAYLPHLGVDRCARSLLVDPGRLVLGTDLVTCKSEHSIEWNVHSRVAFNQRSENGRTVFDLAAGVRLVMLSPMDARWESGLMECIPAYPNDGTRDYRCAASIRSSTARFIWCYLLASQAVPELRAEAAGEFSVRFADGSSLVFDGHRFFSRGNR